MKQKFDHTREDLHLAMGLTEEEIEQSAEFLRDITDRIFPGRERLRNSEMFQALEEAPFSERLKMFLAHHWGQTSARAQMERSILRVS